MEKSIEKMVLHNFLKNIIKIINNFFYKKKELNNKYVIELPNGTKCYYDNKYQYLKLPNGSKFYYDHRVDKYRYHRADGPAIEYDNGGKEYYINGLRHRLDGPAVEGSNGTKLWYLNDELHRLDGPAIEYADGTKKYYLYNIEINESAMKYISSAPLVKKY